MRPYMVAAGVVFGTWFFCYISMGAVWLGSSSSGPRKEKDLSPSTSSTLPKSTKDPNMEGNGEKREKEFPYDHVLFFIERFESTVSHSKRGGPFGEVLLYQSAEHALLSMGLDVSFMQEKNKFRNEVTRLMEEQKKFLVFSCEYSLKGTLEVLKEQRVSLCVLRLLDFWGTPPEQNHIKINPKQYLVPYPNPWNTFLGLDIQSRMFSKEGETIQKESCGVVWGKEPKYFDAAMDWLFPLTKTIQLHTTIRGMLEPLKNLFFCLLDCLFSRKDGCFHMIDETERIKEFVLSGNVVNHGIVSPEEFHQLLVKCRFFVGLGGEVQTSTKSITLCTRL